MIKLGSIILKSLKDKGLDRQVEASLICKEFNDLKSKYFPPKVADQMQAVYIKHCALTIAVLHPVLKQEIKAHENEILKKMQDKFGEKNIERFNFLA